MAEQDVVAGHCRHGRRFAHALPSGYFFPCRKWARCVCRRNGRYASGHARECPGTLQWGEMQPGITLRDLVHAIPLQAIKDGHLTVAKEGKKNIFSGRILEIEGLGHLK